MWINDMQCTTTVHYSHKVAEIVNWFSHSGNRIRNWHLLALRRYNNGEFSKAPHKGVCAHSQKNLIAMWSCLYMAAYCLVNVV